MFYKIISNLPFQPALLSQLSTYLRILQKEVKLRKISVYLFLAVFFVQIFIVVAPSKPTLMTNSSDIVYGGNSKEEILHSYIKNRDMLGHDDIKDIYNHYGITDKQIISSNYTTLRQAPDSSYINVARNPSNISDYFIKTSSAGNGGVYEFPLSYWGDKPYQALTGVSSHGFQFWILLNGSGNIVYSKDSKSASIEITKAIILNPIPKPNDTSIYSIRFHNISQSVAKNTSINSILPAEFEYQSYTSNQDLLFSRNGQRLKWTINNKDSSLAPSASWVNIDVSVKARDIASFEQIACDSTSISSDNSPLLFPKESPETQCLKIKKLVCPNTDSLIANTDYSDCLLTCPDNSTLNNISTCNKPQLACLTLRPMMSPDWVTRRYQASIILKNDAPPPKISYFINNKLVETHQFNQGQTTDSFQYSFQLPNTYTVRAELISADGTAQQSQNCSLTQTISKPTDSTPKVTKNVTVRNITKNLANANNTMANHGDILEYGLTVNNIGDTNIDNFDFKDEFTANINDVLEYADLLDNNSGFTTKSGYIYWMPSMIKPGESISKNFKIKIKNSSFTTPVSVSNPLSNDLVLKQSYGNTTTIRLQKPMSKRAEQLLARVQPITSPWSIFIVIFILISSMIFYMRSKILKNEAEIIHKEYSAGGL